MLFVGDDEEVCNKNTDESSCNTCPGASCSWCTSAAVKAACHSVKNAKTLPPAVFSCSNIGEVEEPVEIEEVVKDSVEDMCKVRTDESTCVSDFQCGWCNDGCHSIENAQDDGCELPLPPMPQPPRIFQEMEQMMNEITARFHRQPLFLKDQEAVCNAFKDETKCHTNAKCSWCESAAVPSACHDIQNTKYLPEPNFSCSPKLPE